MRLSNTKKGLSALAVAIAFPFLMMLVGYEYAILIGCYVMMYIISVSGLDILFGYSGQISMGHAGFYAIGAYGSVLLHTYLGIPVMLAILIACAIAAVVGFLIAYPAVKLVAHFLSLATIAFGEIIYNLISHSPKGITGDFTGLFSSGFIIFGHELKSDVAVYFLGLFFVVIFLLAKVGIINSKVGRAFIAIRENAHAANGMGIDVRKYKVLAFTISAIYTAFGGAFFAHMVGFISPDTFVKKQSVAFITMLLFGGTASIPGTCVGVVSILLILELLRGAQKFQLLIYGGLMLIAIVAMPGGLYRNLVGLFGKLKEKVVNRKDVSKC